MAAGCKETLAITEDLVKVVDVMKQRLDFRGAPGPVQAGTRTSELSV